MKKVTNLVILLLISLLLINVFLPINLADSENANQENNNSILYNNIELEENKTLLSNNEVNDVIEKEETNIEENEKIEEKQENKVLIENTIPNELNEQTTIENDDVMPLNDTTGLAVQYKTHVQNIGWQDYVQDGNIAGTSGKGYRLEGINIQLLNSEKNLNIKYQVHVQNIGWQGWKKNGEVAGTSGQSLRLEAIRICLDSSDNYSIQYRVHVQNIGWQDWKIDGEMAGTSGQNLRLEAIQIKIIPKQKKGRLCIDTPSNGNTYYSSSDIRVQGWKMSNISNTFIKAYIDNIEIDSKTITYYNRTDVINAILDCGTASQNPKAGFYFSFNSNNISSGQHTLKIELYSEKDIISTESTNFYIDKNLHINYRTHVQHDGWQGYVKDGQMSGTSGKSYRVEALNISLINAPENAKILYRTHVQNIGWQKWKENGEMAGTEGKAYRIEAIEIILENMDKYTVEYQVHIQDKGWTDWYMDGETAGTVGQERRIEAIRIRLVAKKEKRLYKGIDVSKFNGSVNWGFVKRDGIEFAFIKAGFRGYGSRGTLNEDPCFRLNIQGAKQAGIPVGVYFITQAITAEEAIQEANWVVERVKDYNIEYPIAIDIEAPGLEKPDDIPRTQNLDKNTRTYLAKVFCQTIQKAGYTPIIYCNIDWAYNYLNMSELSEYDTWIASYRDNNPGYNGKYSIWQYTSKGQVNGVLGYVDRNICYKKY